MKNMLLLMASLLVMQYKGINAFNASEYFPFVRYREDYSIVLLNKYNVTSSECGYNYWGTMNHQYCWMKRICSYEFIQTHIDMFRNLPFYGIEFKPYHTYYYSKPTYFAVISKCNIYPKSNITVTENIKEKCEKDSNDYNDLDLFTNALQPFYNNEPIFVYKNKFCALCNNITDPIQLPLRFSCNETIVRGSSNISQILQVLMSKCVRVLNYESSIKNYNIFSNLMNLRENQTLKVNNSIDSVEDLADIACRFGNYQNVKLDRNLFCYITKNYSIDNCQVLAFDFFDAYNYHADLYITFSEKSIIDTIIYNNQVYQEQDLDIIKTVCDNSSIEFYKDPLLTYCQLNKCNSTKFTYHPLFKRCIDKLSLVRIEGDILVDDKSKYYPNMIMLKIILKQFASTDIFGYINIFDIVIYQIYGLNSPFLGIVKLFVIFDKVIHSFYYLNDRIYFTADVLFEDEKIKNKYLQQIQLEPGCNFRDGTNEIVERDYVVRIITWTGQQSNITETHSECNFLDKSNNTYNYQINNYFDCDIDYYQIIGRKNSNVDLNNILKIKDNKTINYRYINNFAHGALLEVGSCSGTKEHIVLNDDPVFMDPGDSKSKVPNSNTTKLIFQYSTFNTLLVIVLCVNTLISNCYIH